MAEEKKKSTCSAIAREWLASLLALREREPGNLGALGPCAFREPMRFFDGAVRITDRAPPRWDYPHAPDVVAIGDVHGDFGVLLTLLCMTECVDQQANWIGESKVVVLCGDVLDSGGRGCDSRSPNQREEVDILQYIHMLRLQAREQKGDLVAVLGNHEVARVQRWPGFGRYISREQVAGWGGTAKMNELFSETMGIYLALYFPLFVRVGQFVFLHAGVPPDVPDHISTPEAINQAMFDVLAKGLKEDPVFRDVLLPMLESRAPMNPSRADESSSGAICSRHIRRLMAFFNIQGGFVLGHTTQSTLTPYCSGKVWRIDLGMSRAFCRTRRRLGALVIRQATPETSTIDYYEGDDTGRYRVRRFDTNGNLLTER